MQEPRDRGQPGRSGHALARRRTGRHGTAHAARGRACETGSGRASEEPRVNILPGDFDDPQVLALLRVHLAGMHDASPPGSVYALDLSGLKAPEIAFFTAWEGAALLGMGALKALDATSGEIKSMRTRAEHLRRGVAARILDHLLGVARSRGYRRVSLETGSGEAFEPALALYRKVGFVNGPCFGDYAPSPFNQFLHLAL